MPCGIMLCGLDQRAFWDGEWIALGGAPVTADDVGTWPYSVGILGLMGCFLELAALASG